METIKWNHISRVTDLTWLMTQTSNINSCFSLKVTKRFKTRLIEKKLCKEEYMLKPIGPDCKENAMRSLTYYNSARIWRKYISGLLLRTVECKNDKNAQHGYRQGSDDTMTIKSPVCDKGYLHSPHILIVAQKAVNCAGVWTTIKHWRSLTNRRSRDTALTDLDIGINLKTKIVKKSFIRSKIGLASTLIQ